MNLKNINKIIFEFDLEEEPRLNDSGEFDIELPLVEELLKISKINPHIRIILISKRTGNMFELEFNTQGFRMIPRTFDLSVFE